ncbi:amino acid ABC transporter permease [Halopseudomonas pelagia]|uniref:amino acid ABC transporter permease n=1 Tax=Halopseudomonas pelagia TaxID=553151 RepID=UPI00039FCDD3|nr:amino acid ABC transporter permease [Halopseudomonas pelagia]|tara:strand:- start:4258 stop:4905 length:648 start_codon:yes stop_codon:yes gene_type:complete
MTAYDYWSIVQGSFATVGVSLTGILLGVPLGLGLALLRWARIPVVRQVCYLYVSIVRSCPAVTLILLIYFGLPQFGLSLNPLAAALIALSMTAAAFSCEIWRSSLIAFDRQQYDAALAFGMPAWLRVWRIVLPQAWQSSLPGLVNEMTMLIKSSPAIAVIGMVEITRAAQRVGARTYDPLPPLMFGLCLYLVIIFVLVRAQRRLERKTPGLGVQV